MDLEQFERRKREHIQLALKGENQATGLTGLDRVHLFHDALPEMDFEQLSIESMRLGQPSKSPFFIAALTWGHTDAIKINRLLANACSRRGWALGLGSQRRDLESIQKNEPCPFIEEWQEILSEFSPLTVIGNIGLSQAIQCQKEHLDRLARETGVTALAIHANPLQEILQLEGTPSFARGVEMICNFSAASSTPIILKETGCGFSKNTLLKLKEAKLAAIDIAGLGGTHWARIEGKRSDALRAMAAKTFNNWGETTVDSVLAARETLPGIDCWASGGVRTGLDAAKLLSLGAVQVGYAQPALAAAIKGEEELHEWMDQQEFELKIAMFCSGSKTLKELVGKNNVRIERDHE